MLERFRPASVTVPFTGTVEGVDIDLGARTLSVEDEDKLRCNAHVVGNR
jgi:hypothetical protein